MKKNTKSKVWQTPLIKSELNIKETLKGGANCDVVGCATGS